MAKRVDAAPVTPYFETLSDFGHTRSGKHPLPDVAVIAVLGILCGADSPTVIHHWAKYHETWLAQYLALPNRIPSRDCIRQLLMALRPETFQRCFQAWLTDTIDTQSDQPNRLRAIDNQGPKRSQAGAKSLGALPSLTTWATEGGIAFGQVAAVGQSNEDTAIPQLLEEIDVKDTFVTFDAMLCEHSLVEPLVKRGADCILTVSANQEELLTDLQSFFYKRMTEDFEDLRYACRELTEIGPGAIDERSYFLARVPAKFEPTEEWPKIKAIGYAIRVIEDANGNQLDEMRYYLSTSYLSPKRFSESVRTHWGVESMPWVLDVNFREDEGRSREPTLANNLSALQKFALTLVKRHPDKKSLQAKLTACSLSTDYLAQVLSAP